MMKHILHFVAFIAIFFGAIDCKAQNLLTQGFEGTFPPSGWSSIYVSGSNGYCSSNVYWQQETSNTSLCSSGGSAPYPAAHGGSHCAGYDAYWDGPGYPNSNYAQALLITPALNLTTYSGGNYTLTFYYYAIATNDFIQVLVNTSASKTGATTLSPNCSSSSGSWVLETYTIPSSYYTSSNVYVIFNAISGYDYDIFIDDVSVDFALPACSGTPIAPTITSGSVVTPFCAGSSTTITGTNTANTSGSSGHYTIWQQSTSSSTGPFTNISGATSLSYTTPALTTTTYYRLKDSCGASHLTNTSSTYTVPVTATVTPSVSIAPSPTGSICPNTNVTFTASSTNGGTTPVYQWKKNGNNVGTNSTTYSDNTLTNGNTIQCVLTSNAVCPTSNPVNSNTISQSVISFTPTVSISSNPGNSICLGTSVTFTASITNGGTSPVYQWTKNGNNVGTNSSTYTDGGLANGDVINCTLTSNAVCLSTPTANSQITMTVLSYQPSISVAASPSGTICPGTLVTFTATATNGGSSPTYQWKKNGNNVGTNSNVYTDNGLYNNDVVFCVLTSSQNCAQPTTATSNFVTINNTTPITINTQPANSVVCNGTGTIFSVSASAGSAISYQWMVNTGSGFTPISNNATYSGATTSSLTVSSTSLSMNGSQYQCILSASCALSVTSIVTLDVNMPPSIIIQPSSVVSCTNATANMSVTANGNSLSYQWMVNSGGGGTQLSRTIRRTAVRPAILFLSPIQVLR